MPFDGDQGAPAVASWVIARCESSTLRGARSLSFCLNAIRKCMSSSPIVFRSADGPQVRFVACVSEVLTESCLSSHRRTCAATSHGSLAPEAVRTHRSGPTEGHAPQHRTGTRRRTFAIRRNIARFAGSRTRPHRKPFRRQRKERSTGVGSREPAALAMHFLACLDGRVSRLSRNRSSPQHGR
jgi:hypothetical protein